MTTSEPLRSKLARGFRWNVVGQSAGHVLFAISTVVLARKLTPNDFSFAALGYSVLVVLLSLFGQGFAQAIMAKNLRDRESMDTLFTLYVAMGLAAGGVLAAVSGVVEDFYGKPGLKAVCLVLSAQLFANVVSHFPKVLLDRDFRFPRANAVLVVKTFVSAVVGIAMAYGGHGYWALIGSSVVSSLVEAVALLIAAQVTPRLTFSWAHFRRIARFGAVTSATDLMNTVVSKGDYLILGTTWAPHTLGTYFFAFEKANRPFELITPKFSTMLLPALAAMEKDLVRMRRGFLQILQVNIAVTVPVAALMMATAESVLTLIFGDQWRPSVGTFFVLSAAWIPRPFCSPVALLLYALDRPRLTFTNAVMKMSAMLPFFSFAAWKGLLPLHVAIGIAVISTLIYVRLGMHGYRIVGLPLSEVLAKSWRVLVGSGLGMIAGFTASRLAAHQGIGDGGRFAISTALFAIAGGPFLLIEFRALYRAHLARA